MRSVKSRGTVTKINWHAENTDIFIDVPKFEKDVNEMELLREFYILPGRSKPQTEE
jgi:hypothetical protein